MKHDRPVSELLDECARALPEPFTRQDILAWFRRMHPDVPPNTVSARIFGLTEGDAPSRDHFQFGGSRPVLERVGRGLYRRARGRPRQPALFGDADRASGHARDVLPIGDVILVGGVRTTTHHAAPAAYLYTGALFARRRRYAEAAGRPWFVLSGRWGCVAPDEIVAPAELTLGDMPPAYRHGWAEHVVGSLAGVLPLAGAIVEIHAGDQVIDALRGAFEREGAALADAVDAHSLAETLTWYDQHPLDTGVLLPD